MSACSVADCESQMYALSWCKLHYTRWWRHGDPLHTKQDCLKGLSNVERFTRKWRIDQARNCWA